MSVRQWAGLKSKEQDKLEQIFSGNIKSGSHQSGRGTQENRLRTGINRSNKMTPGIINIMLKEI